MPETQYAVNGDLNIAFQVIGEGPRDLVYVPGWVSNIEVMWEDPGLARFLRRLASFSRLITFDKQGTGLSDPVPLHQLPDLERRMDDLRAVMNEVGSERATLFGHSEGGNLCLLFGATYPDRTDGVILTGAPATRIWSDDYPWAPSKEDKDCRLRMDSRMLKTIPTSTRSTPTLPKMTIASPLFLLSIHVLPSATGLVETVAGY